MNGHPLLTKVLAQGITEAPPDPVGPGIYADAEAYVAGIPPAIADRLEAALDVCQYVVEFRDGSEAVCKGMARSHSPATHPYVPLVTP